MGLLNPTFKYLGGDTLLDLQDRFGQHRTTAAGVVNATPAGAGTTNAGVSGELPFQRNSTTGTANNVASSIGSALGSTYGIPYRLTAYQVSIGTITSVRVFVGLRSATGSDNFTSDTPTNDAYGFRFSTAAGDTTWKCVCNNNAGNTATDSLITVTTGQFLLTVVAISNTSIQYYINRVLVKTNTTNLPRTSVTNYAPSWGLQTLTNAIRTLDMSFCQDRMHAV